MDVKETKNYLWDLFVDIAIDVNKPPIIYETYILVLHIWK
jgi:hypothetical protein